MNEDLNQKQLIKEPTPAEVFDSLPAEQQKKLVSNLKIFVEKVNFLTTEISKNADN